MQIDMQPQEMVDWTDPETGERRQVTQRFVDNYHRQREEARRRQERADAAEARRKAQWQKVNEARQVDLAIVPAGQRPAVQELQAQLDEAQAEAKEAKAAIETAAARAEQLQEEAVTQEARAEMGEIDEAKAEQARQAADEARDAHVDAKALFARKQRVVELTERKLETARRKAQEAVQAEGEALYQEALAQLQEALGEAVAANEQLYKVARKLRELDVETGPALHYGGLMRVIVAGRPTTYSKWLQRVEQHG